MTSLRLKDRLPRQARYRILQQLVQFAALLQRFRCYSFSSGKPFAAAAQTRLAEIWRDEAGDLPLPTEWRHWGFTSDGQFSLRVALDRMQDHLATLEVAA